MQPAQHRVRVTLTLTLANHLADTKTTRYYFDKAFLAVLPGTKAFAMSWDGSGTPSVAVSKSTKDYTLLRLGLAQRLYSGKTATYRLRFDLPDPGGAATRDLRIGDSLASFPVWGFGSDSTSGGSVTVVFPKGFTVDVQAGSIPKPVTDATGRVIFRSGTLVEPAVVLRLSRRRPAGRLRHDVPQGDRRGQPGRADRPVLARRQGLVQARRGPHGQGAAGPRRARSGWRGRRPGP